MIEDAYVAAALEEALAVVEEMERADARSAAAAWWSCVQVLRRQLATPPAFPEKEIVDFGCARRGRSRMVDPWRPAGSWLI